MFPKKVLFITEKWPDANPEFGLTNNYHNLFGSLSTSGIQCEIDVLHFDEIYRDFGNHIDVYSEELIKESSPDVVIVSHLGMSPLNPTTNTYKKIKSMGINLLFVWPDTRTWAISEIDRLYELSDLNVSWGCEMDDSQPLNDKHIWMWAPQDSSLYFDDTKTEKISFVGSLNGYNSIRMEYINHLLKNGIDIKTYGGQREQKLSYFDYAKFVRQSEINLNFSVSADVHTPHQCKGRVMEVTACNSLLMESKNTATQRRFTPGLHYVEYISKTDLVDKIQYFTKNELERKQIAQCGYDYFNSHYTNYIYWSTVFERLTL